MYDVVIIGAGVIGCSAARYLSRYRVNACVLEREPDVCEGTSKANSAIVHAGYDAKNGSLMAYYNVRGSEMMEELSHELDFPYERVGSLVVCLNEEDRGKLSELLENGKRNGVRDLRIVEREELRELEPNISPDAVAALFAPTGAIICPFGLTYAMAENAAENGIEFRLGVKVTGISRTGDGYRIETDKGPVETKAVINAAGVYADVFHNMVSRHTIHITPRKGEYRLLDHTAGDFVRHTVFQLPGKYGKGVLVSPTVHGNVIVGPTANDIPDREGTNTTAEGLREVASKSGLALPDIPLRETITSFAGLRAHEDGHEFIIGEVKDAPGFFDCAGIESPGLSSAPAIGEAISDMVSESLGLLRNEEFKAKRKGFLDPKKLSMEERNALIRENPAYGQIICRCESVTEGEILDAIRRSPGARTVDGVKRRVRAGMGRCQAGFCSPKVIDILARELGIPKDEVLKSGPDSRFIVGEIKDRL